MTTDTIGTIANNGTLFGSLLSFPITASASGPLTSIGVNCKTASGNIRVAIYSSRNSTTLSGLLGQSSSVAAVSGWNDLAIPGVTIVSGTTYYLALQASDGSNCALYYQSGQTNAQGAHASYSYGVFTDPVSIGLGNNLFNMRMSYTSSTTYSRSFGDSTSVSDGFSRLCSIIRTSAETLISVSDSETRGLQIFRVDTEGYFDPIYFPSQYFPTYIGVSDSFSQNLQLQRTDSEPSISISDTESRTLQAFRSDVETGISVTDAYGRTRTVPGTLNETISVSDSESRLLQLYRTDNESALSVNDSESRLLQIFRIDNEPAATISDMETRVLHAFRIDNESSLLISDQFIFVQAGGHTYLITLNEPSISILDTESRQLQVFRTENEPSTIIADQESRIVQIVRALSEPSIVISDLETAIRTIYKGFIGIGQTLQSSSLGRVLTGRSQGETQSNTSQGRTEEE